MSTIVKQYFLIFFLIIYILLLAPLDSTAKSTEMENWKNMGEGIDLMRINSLNKLGKIESRLILYRFNPALFNIRILCSKDFGYQGADVKTLAKASGSVAIINSSFFDAQGNAIAYLKCSGKVVNSRKATHSLYSGVFFVKRGKPHIVHSSKFHHEKSVSDAVQAGPLLISKGKGAIGLKNIHAVRHRSGIATDRKGNVIIYVTSSEYEGISWKNLQLILEQKAIDAYEVLNLDGGGSTQMYISIKDFEDYTRGSTRVPTAIAFFTK